MIGKLIQSLDDKKRLHFNLTIKYFLYYIQSIKLKYLSWGDDNKMADQEAPGSHHPLETSSKQLEPN